MNGLAWRGCGSTASMWQQQPAPWRFARSFPRRRRMRRFWGECCNDGGQGGCLPREQRVRATVPALARGSVRADESTSCGGWGVSSGLVGLPQSDRGNGGVFMIRRAKRQGMACPYRDLSTWRIDWCMSAMPCGASCCDNTELEPGLLETLGLVDRWPEWLAKLKCAGTRCRGSHERTRTVRGR